MTEPNDEYPEIEIAPRDWGDEEVVSVTALILASSRDGHGDPVAIPTGTARWRNLGKRAEKAGWSVTVTYALAWWPDQYYLNGKLSKAAHHVHTVAIRCVRAGVRAFAIWTRKTHGPDLPLDEWSFSVGFIGYTGHKARAFTTALLS